MTWDPGLGKMDRCARHEVGGNEKSYGVKTEVSLAVRYKLETWATRNKELSSWN